MVEILHKRRHLVESLDVTVDGEQQPNPPWTYTRIALHFRVVGEGLTVPVLARVIRLSVARYCSVITTIAAAAAIEATVELTDGDGASSGRRLIELAIPALPLPDVPEPAADEDEPEKGHRPAG